MMATLVTEIVGGEAYQYYPNENDGIAPYRNENVSSALTQGVELSVAARATGRLRLDAGYTFLNTLNRELDQPLEGRSLHRVTLSCEGKELLAGIDGTLRASWSSAQVYYADADDECQQTVECDVV